MGMENLTGVYIYETEPEFGRDAEAEILETLQNHLEVDDE